MPNGWNAPLALRGCLWARNWGVALGWYEPGHWPKIYAMPQSLRLVVIHVIFGTKDRRELLPPRLLSGQIALHGQTRLS
jgi:hypothetical protein